VIANLRLAALRLWATPVSTLAAISCLALGLAGAMIVFTVMQQLVLRPTAIPAGDAVRLLDLEVGVGGQQQQLARWSYPGYEALRDSLAPEYAAIAMTVDPLWLTLSAGASTQRIQTEIVSPGYFSALGVKPALGVDLSPSDSTAVDARVWLSHTLWRDAFGGDAEIIGQQVLLQGKPFSVAGVLPAGFKGISEQAAAYIPMSAAPSVTFANRLRGATSFWHSVMIVPASGTTAALDARLSTVGTQVRDAIGLRIDGELAEVSVHSRGWTLTRVDPVLRQTATAVGWGTAVLLAIVVVNLVLLALTRQDQRRREFGLRISLGAGRVALLQLVVAEMLLLFGSGLLLAWLLGGAGLATLARYGDLVSVGGVGLDDLHLGAASAGFGVALAALVLALVLAGPARNALALNATSALRANPPSRGLGSRRWLAGTQFALATALMIGAGCAATAAWRALQVPLGFDPSQVLTSQVALPDASLPADGVAGFLTRMTATLALAPGVQRAATAACLPIRGGCDFINLEAVPRVDDADWPASLNMVSGDYFGALGVPLIEGRYLDQRDRANAPAVAVLSASAAQRYFPQGTAIGRKISVSIGFPEDPAGATVIGVVGDVLDASLDEAAAPMVYLSALQTNYPDNMIVLQAHAGIDAQSLAATLSTSLRQVQPELALWDTATMEQRHDGLTARRRLVATLTGALAGLSLLLAGTGVFAVFDLLVRRRQREFGVRITLGASQASLRRSVLLDALTTTGIATAVGLILGVFALIALASQLPGMPTTPIPVLAAVLVLMTATAALASWWPARKAARADPVITLRQEA
jgi:putative ABC transport system permease protein